jgi:hypothetical protein
MNRLMPVVLLSLLAASGGGEDNMTAGPRVQKASNDWTVPREGSAGLQIRTPRGTIRVVVVKSDRRVRGFEPIEIHATRQVGAESSVVAQSLLEQIRIDRRREGDHWVVEASWPIDRSRGPESPQVSFGIRLPSGMQVAAYTGSGAIRIEGSADPVEAESPDGSIEIRQAPATGSSATRCGTLELEVAPAGGPVDVRVTGGSEQDLHLQGGAFRISTRGPIHLRTSQGAIRVRLSHSPP